MEQQKKFPTEIVELPSKGLLYAEDSPLRSVFYYTKLF